MGEVREILATSILAMEGVDAEVAGFFVMEIPGDDAEDQHEVVFHAGPFADEADAVDAMDDLEEDGDIVVVWFDGVDSGIEFH